jgi:antitoxin VapB
MNSLLSANIFRFSATFTASVAYDFYGPIGHTTIPSAVTVEFAPVTPVCIYFMYIQRKGSSMSTARVFKSGNSQAVRLPKQFRLRSGEVDIFRRGDEIVLREKKKNMARAFDLLADLPDDLDLRREKDYPQERKGL